MKKLFAFILLFLFLVIPAQAHEGNHTIVITSNGYFTQNISIDKEETIIFKNEDKKDHWPASNIHPTHQIYPEFDPLKPIKPGESWSFKFTKPGEWKYHDHLYPQITGVIIVKGEKKVDKKPVFSFAVKAQVAKLYYFFFPEQLNKTLGNLNMHKVSKNNDQTKFWIIVLGGKKFMQKLIHDSGGGSLVDCHREAHRAGRIGYELFGQLVFKDGTSDCHSGYYHGAMEAFLKEKGTINLAENIEKLCESFTTNFTIFECLHGVGHGVTAYDDYNIPLSLRTCGQLGTSFEKRSCYGGVFMENIVTSQGNGALQDHQTQWVNSNPQFPCSGVDQNSDIQEECYKMQTTRMLDLLNRDFLSVSDECLNAPNAYKATCFQSLGRDAAGYTLRDPKKITDICIKVPMEYFNNCIAGAFNVIVDFWGEGLDSQAEDLCRQVPSFNKKSCYSLLGSRLKNVFGKNIKKINSLCNVFEKEYKSICLEGANKI